MNLARKFEFVLDFGFRISNFLLGFCFALIFNCVLDAEQQALPRVAPTSRYEFRPDHDPDGIGKFYLGREIAHVMGHESAAWLERDERNREENTQLLMQELPIKPGDTVADIGAGTGYLSRRLSAKVGPGGKVFAEDIQPEMLDLLRTNLTLSGLTNITTVLGTTTDPKLPPEAVDVVVMMDVYHEFDFPFEMTQAICGCLRPGGRLVFVEFRAEDPKVPIKPVHKMTEVQMKKEMTGHPLEWVETKEVLPWQHIIIFKKRSLR